MLGHGSNERPPVAEAWPEKAKKRQQPSDYMDESETQPLSGSAMNFAAEMEEEEDSSSSMNRRKEEAKVLKILQKRLALVAEERQGPPEIPGMADLNQPTLLLAKLLRKKQPLEPSPAWAQLETDWGDSEFISDCLRWHNICRQKHSAELLTISPQLCAYAQAWANHLAHTTTFYYRNDRQIGQNLFCRPTGPQSQAEISGRDIALHWYGDMRHYDFFQGLDKLHANVNAGHFTQMIWASSKQLGLGKAQSRNGRTIVVANYHPPGNINGHYQQNVRPPLPGSDPRLDVSMMLDEVTESASEYSIGSSTSSVSSDNLSVISRDSLLHSKHSSRPRNKK